ncbi:hypothetical protein GGP84_001040 [Salinibacter ruber]|uniref:DUF4230 domain-containing protein n=1 Tax=Salinibacter ruber TaxID=146919 RepID=UPI00216A0825|nr:DUF4230 domain-containing protein [Salinibacter ruber]MCS3938425.1 hypothetical protein [Salinibacter ruber]
MTTHVRAAIGGGVIAGLLLVVGVLLWDPGPSDATVRKTVLTTIQDEAPASFLVTGTLDMRATVRVDSAQYLTPSWLTSLLRQTQPSALPLLRGGSETQVRVPGTVSYGFDVQTLDASMIAVDDPGRVGVALPSLTVHSVEPDLGRLEVRSQASGWMRVLPSDMPAAVRREALGAVKAAFREQAARRLEAATQPRVNTARALKKMLRPALEAAGVEAPQFRIRVGDELVLQPKGG